MLRGGRRAPEGRPQCRLQGVLERRNFKRTLAGRGKLPSPDQPVSARKHLGCVRFPA